MEKEQIIDIIKQNPQLSFEEIRKQASQAGVPDKLLSDAWSEAKSSENQRKKVGLRIILIIAAVIAGIFLLLLIFISQLGHTNDPATNAFLDATGGHNRTTDLGIHSNLHAIGGAMEAYWESNKHYPGTPGSVECFTESSDIFTQLSSVYDFKTFPQPPVGINNEISNFSSCPESYVVILTSDGRYGLASRMFTNKYLNFDLNQASKISNQTTLDEIKNNLIIEQTDRDKLKPETAIFILLI